MLSSFSQTPAEALLWAALSKWAQREAKGSPMLFFPAVGTGHSLLSAPGEGVRKHRPPQQGLGAPQPEHLASTLPLLRKQQGQHPHGNCSVPCG